jgi:glycine/D-amino acid oxidase-like deaminating enzyme/nitrite reductase/ring-hydroxylating ferredoxin subunit
MASTKPVWDTIQSPKYPKLMNDVTCDVAVIGGGITGLTAAYLLKKAGKRVCVLERYSLGDGDTGNTTAHLTCVTDFRLMEMAKIFGKPAAGLVWQGGMAAISIIEQNAKSEGIPCDFRRVPGFLHASFESKKDESKELQRDCKLARELGFAADFLEEVPVVHREGIRIANQAKFHPLKYLSGLARAVQGNGCNIYEQSEATEFSKKPHGVKVNGRQVTCDYVVIATHVPLMGKTGLINATLLQSKLAPYSTYVIGARIPGGDLPEASFWDTTDPYYYLRIDKTEKGLYAIFGGKDHKTGQSRDPDKRYADMTKMLLKIIPQAKVDRRWSGQVIETNDGLPYIGETAEHQFVATGYAGNGMTFGTLAGMMACDAALGRKNPWQDLFSVNRKKIRGGTWDYVSENVDYPYYMVRDRLKSSEASSPSDVRRGDGKVIQIEGKRVACSRDEKGKVAMVSAVCTHMGCIVHWNNAEKSWDCPCHGSRFATTGEVIGGPAETPLETVQMPPTAAIRATAQSKTRPRRRLAAAKKGR